MQLVRSLLVSLALLVLGTSLAHAHDGSAHEATAAAQEQAVALVGAGGGSSFSPSCPGAPGTRCCCGTLSALSATGKAGVVMPRWTLRLEPKAGPVAVFNIPSPPHAAPLLRRARPRAPPGLS